MVYSKEQFTQKFMLKVFTQAEGLGECSEVELKSLVSETYDVAIIIVDTLWEKMYPEGGQ